MTILGKKTRTSTNITSSPAPVGKIRVIFDAKT